MNYSNLPEEEHYFQRICKRHYNLHIQITKPETIALTKIFADFLIKNFVDSCILIS